MKADISKAEHQPGAAQRMDERATAPRAGAADTGAAAALSHAARRANAGPHASSLAALQAVVAQRACADCETVRRTMGGGAPVHRAPSKDAGARAPVQRLILGAEGQYDTRNPGDNAGIIAELRSADYASLQAVRRLLDPREVQDRYYMELIDYEIDRADALGDIDTLGRDEGGVHTTEQEYAEEQVLYADSEELLGAVSAHARKYRTGVPTAASVFVDGTCIFSTEPVSHPESDTTLYQRSDETKEEQWAEEDVSRNDSEVATLEFAWRDLDKNLAARKVDGEGQQVQLPAMAVRIVLAGLSGPCDGCKERIERFRLDILGLLPPGSSLDLESAYLNRAEKTTRSNSKWKQKLSTEYGWTDAEENRTADGNRYFRYFYPQQIAAAPAGAGDFAPVAADEYGAAPFDHGPVQDQPAWTSDGAMAGPYGWMGDEADQAAHGVATVPPDIHAGEHDELAAPRQEPPTGGAVMGQPEAERKAPPSKQARRRMKKRARENEEAANYQVETTETEDETRHKRPRHGQTS